MRGLLCSALPYNMTSRLEMTHQPSTHWANWAKNHSPILRIAWLAMLRTAGQGESDGYFAAPSFLWRNNYIATSAKVGKSALISVPIFAFVTQGIVESFCCRPKDTDLKVEELLSRFTARVFD